MFYGFVITEAGNQILAKMVAGQTLKLSGVFMDLGTVEDKETARQLTAPLEPGPAGTSTVPTVKGNQVGMIVQFRSDLDGGLKEDKWIGGFGVYAEHYLQQPHAFLRPEAPGGVLPQGLQQYYG